MAGDTMKLRQSPLIHPRTPIHWINPPHARSLIFYLASIARGLLTAGSQVYLFYKSRTGTEQ